MTSVVCVVEADREPEAQVSSVPKARNSVFLAVPDDSGSTASSTSGDDTQDVPDAASNVTCDAKSNDNGSFCFVDSGTAESSSQPAVAVVATAAEEEQREELEMLETEEASADGGVAEMWRPPPPVPPPSPFTGDPDSLLTSVRLVIGEQTHCNITCSWRL